MPDAYAWNVLALAPEDAGEDDAGAVRRVVGNPGEAGVS